MFQANECNRRANTENWTASKNGPKRNQKKTTIFQLIQTRYTSKKHAVILTIPLHYMKQKKIGTKYKCDLLFQNMNVLGQQKATYRANSFSVYEQKKSFFTNSESNSSQWDSEAQSNNCLSVLPAVFNIE